jgi:hypothetical protein
MLGTELSEPLGMVAHEFKAFCRSEESVESLGHRVTATTNIETKYRLCDLDRPERTSLGLAAGKYCIESATRPMSGFP